MVQGSSRADGPRRGVQDLPDLRADRRKLHPQPLLLQGKLWPCAHRMPEEVAEGPDGHKLEIKGNRIQPECLPLRDLQDPPAQVRSS